MGDPVNAADVLARRFGASGTWAGASAAIDALLACGGGDPVVIMPDGTLRRWLWGGLADPVQPEGADRHG